jgi:MFS family permease
VGLEPWFLAAALLALGCSGVAPMLLPLEVVRIEGRAVHVGVVMAAIGAGLVTAPLWSRLADRRRSHRGTMVGGGLAIAAALGGFAVAEEWHEWTALAFVMGAGAAAVFTVANVVVIERCASGTQDAAFGWLQTLTTLGTVLGLVVAGAVTHWHLEEEVGFAVAAVLALAGAGSVLLLLAPAGAAAPGDAMAAAGKSGDIEATTSPPSPAGSGPARTAGLPAFALLLVAWLASLLGVNAVSALYPLLMQREFDVPPAISSYALATVTLVSLLLFLPASRLTAYRGGLAVLQGSLAIRFVGLAGLAYLAVTPALASEWLAFVPYAAFSLVWPLLSVSSTILITRLGLAAGGSGPGLGSAAGAAASLAGPVVGGHVADSFGYQAVWVLAAAGVALGLLLTLPLMRVGAAGPQRRAERGVAEAASK